MQSGRAGRRQETASAPSSKASAKPPSRSTTCTSSRHHRVLDKVAELEEEEPEKKKWKKPVEGEDDEIVELPGSNGSGKSNTIDALLFVFGYRSSRMRRGKLSELIHNSARYPDLEECSVEVHFRQLF